MRRKLRHLSVLLAAIAAGTSVAFAPVAVAEPGGGCHDRMTHIDGCGAGGSRDNRVDPEIVDPVIGAQASPLGMHGPSAGRLHGLPPLPAYRSEPGR